MNGPLKRCGAPEWSCDEAFRWLCEASPTAARIYPDRGSGGCRAGTAGLTLIVWQSAQSWFVRFRFPGKRHRYDLGRYSAVNLDEARALAAAALQKVDHRGRGGLDARLVPKGSDDPSPRPPRGGMEEPHRVHHRYDGPVRTVTRLSEQPIQKYSGACRAARWMK
jgi:Arm DNA-binding domain